MNHVQKHVKSYIVCLYTVQSVYRIDCIPYCPYNVQSVYRSVCIPYRFCCLFSTESQAVYSYYSKQHRKDHQKVHDNELHRKSMNQGLVN